MKAVFLDRDGVINENRPDHVKRWEEFRFLPGAAESLAQLHRANYLVFVVTNQAVVNRGLLSRTEIDRINGRMVQEIERRGGRVAEVLYCPHRPDELCQCRKPNPGLLYRAAVTHSLSLGDCYLVGDAISDIAAGLQAGCRTLLVLTGRGRRQFVSKEARQYHGYKVVRNLPKAVQFILAEERRTKRTPVSGVAAAPVECEGLAFSQTPSLVAVQAVGAASANPTTALADNKDAHSVSGSWGARPWRTGTMARELWQESFASSAQCKFMVISGSMRPLIQPGHKVTVRRTTPLQVRIGTIVAFWAKGHVVVHRVIGILRKGDRLYFRQKGDAGYGSELIPAEDLLGRVVSIERVEGTLDLERLRWRLANRWLGWRHGFADVLDRKNGRWLIGWAGRIKRALAVHGQGSRVQAPPPEAGPRAGGLGGVPPSSRPAGEGWSLNTES